MEAIAALGLASSVIQIVDFSSKLVRETGDYIKSSSNALPHNLQLQTFAERCDELAADIEKLTLNAHPPTRSEANLCKLSTDCQKEAKRLIDLLEPLKVEIRPDGKRSKWRAFTKSIQSQFKYDELANSRRQLESPQQQLAGELLRSVHELGLQSADGMKDLTVLMQKQGYDYANAIVQYKDVLLKEIVRYKDELLEGIKATTSSGQQTLESVTRIESRLLDDGEEKLAKGIIDSLYFPEMSGRWHAIEENHPETCNWIFSETSSPFRAWLEREDDKVFWISGDAGSGKSTLVKHLCSSAETRKMLQGWAGTRKLVIADFYYWVAGNRLQRSITGMLQTLLYRALSADASLVPTTVPDRWTSAQSGQQQVPWTSSELMTALRLVSKSSTALFVLVDGLDECDDSKHTQLVEHVAQLACLPGVKVCVSSRPWNVFKRALGHPNIRGRLRQANPEHFPPDACEDALYEDMQQAKPGGSDQSFMYRWQAEENRTRRQKGFSTIDLEARVLIVTICQKAKGVFLWVAIVLESLCERLSNGESIADTQIYVDAFPTRLEDYLKRSIYDRIAETYKVKELSETAMALSIASTCQKQDSPDWFPHSFLNYWLLVRDKKAKNGIIQDVDFGISQTLQQYADVEFTRIIADTERFLNGCCKDLLVLSRRKGDPEIEIEWHGPNATVEFRHRMVYDFIMTGEMQSIITSSVPVHFTDPGFESQLSLAVLKITPSEFAPGPCADEQVRTDLENRCIFLNTRLWLFWRDLPPIGLSAISDVLIQEVQEVALQRLQLCLPGCCCHPTSMIIFYTCQALARFCDNGLFDYAMAVISRKPGLVCADEFSDVLSSAVTLDIRRSQPSDRLRFVRLSLKAGANPNAATLFSGTNHSSWQTLLGTLYRRHVETSSPLSTPTRITTLSPKLTSLVENRSGSLGKPTSSSNSMTADEVKREPGREREVCPESARAATYEEAEVVRAMIEYGAHPDLRICVRDDKCHWRGRTTFCGKAYGDDCDCHGECHEWLTASDVLSFTMPAPALAHIPALMEEYRLPAKRRELREARRRTIQRYDRVLLGEEDLRLLGQPCSKYTGCEGSSKLCRECKERQARHRGEIRMTGCEDEQDDFENSMPIVDS